MGATFTAPILLHALQSEQFTCARRIQFVWVVKSGSNFEWFAHEITQALQLAADRGIHLHLTCCVTCDPTYTANFPVRKSPWDQCCSCNDNLVDQPSLVTADYSDTNSADDKRSDSISGLTKSSFKLNLCQDNCMFGAERSSTFVSKGRPDLHAILDQNLKLARGETGVAECGSQG